MNKAIEIGRLTRDPEVRYSQRAKEVAKRREPVRCQLRMAMGL